MRYVPLDYEHLKYLWAAYRRGVFASLLADGLDPPAFKDAFLATAGLVFQAGGELYVGLGAGGMPVGLLAVTVAGRFAEPRAFWFPEATPRNRLELTIKGLVDLKARRRVVIWAAPQDWKFFNHLGKYGVLRPVGKYDHCFEDGSDAMIYQGVT